MSRIGKLPLQIPDKVQVTLENQIMTVKGPKGELQRELHENVNVEIKDGTITVSKKSDDKFGQSLWGLTRALIANMVEGVTNGFSKKLEIVGVGFKAEMRGKSLVLNLGYSHPIVLKVPDEIKLEAPTPNEVIVSGINKELVGLVASKIRSFRKPEPYKGKGVKYTGEYIRRKAGKTAGK